MAEAASGVEMVWDDGTEAAAAFTAGAAADRAAGSAAGAAASPDDVFFAFDAVFLSR